MCSYDALSSISGGADEKIWTWERGEGESVGALSSESNADLIKCTDAFLEFLGCYYAMFEILHCIITITF